MAVTRLNATNHYVGLSTDVKPIEADEEDVPIGSRFFETDTGHEFIYADDEWTQVFYPTTGA